MKGKGTRSHFSPLHEQRLVFGVAELAGDHACEVGLVSHIGALRARTLNSHHPWKVHLIHLVFEIAPLPSFNQSLHLLAILLATGGGLAEDREAGS